MHAAHKWIDTHGVDPEELYCQDPPLDARPVCKSPDLTLMLPHHVTASCGKPHHVLNMPYRKGTYTGEVDGDGNPHGNGKMQDSSGKFHRMYEGPFYKGVPLDQYMQKQWHLNLRCGTTILDGFKLMQSLASKAVEEEQARLAQQETPPEKGLQVAFSPTSDPPPRAGDKRKRKQTFQVGSKVSLFATKIIMCASFLAWILSTNAKQRSRFFKSTVQAIIHTVETNKRIPKTSYHVLARTCFFGYPGSGDSIEHRASSMRRSIRCPVPGQCHQISCTAVPSVGG